mgnify:CR=1 FL=1
MTLYEISQEILECIDQETGEVIDEERLTALNMAFDQKVSNVACWIKDLLAEAEAIKTEKQNLARRQQVCENKAESLKKWLAFALNGEKFKDARCNISYRKSTSVAFLEDFNIDTLPEEFKKVTVEPRKTEIKNAIKGGAEFDGVVLEEKTNMVIQ